MTDFEGKVAIVTGGNSGIGRATALRFAERGARVVVAARRADQGDAVCDTIRDKGGDALFVRTDVSRAEDVSNLVEKTIEAYGQLDFAFNNAGRPGGGETVSFDEADWDSVMNVNLKGVWLCMKYQLPHMTERGGVIVNNSSVDGILGDAQRPVYSASKHGVVGLTKSVALEYAQRGVKVHAVCPGVIETEIWAKRSYPFDDKTRAVLAPLHPMHDVGSPDDVAEAVLWLCSQVTGFQTGLVLPIDGGQSIGSVQARHPIWPKPC